MLRGFKNSVSDNNFHDSNVSLKSAAISKLTMVLIIEFINLDRFFRRKKILSTKHKIGIDSKRAATSSQSGSSSKL